MLVNKVLVIKDKEKGGSILPRLAFELPSDISSRAYVEQARERVQK